MLLVRKKGNGPHLSSTDQDKHDRQRASDNKESVNRSDLNKRKKLVNTCNGPRLSGTDQEQYDSLIATDNKENW